MNGTSVIDSPSLPELWHFGTGFIGILGTISSCLLFPIPALLEFRSKGSVGDHSPAPHLSAFLSCMLWVVYGLPFVRPNNIYLIIANGGGCFIALFYLVIFAIYSKSWNDKRRRIVTILLIEIVTVGVIGIITFTVSPVRKLRYHILGTIAMICQIGTYFAPLSTLIMAINEKNMELIDPILAAFNVASYTHWFLYAIIPFDLYLFVPNALGGILAFTQAGLFKRYYLYMTVVRGIEVESPWNRLVKIFG